MSDIAEERMVKDIFARVFKDKLENPSGNILWKENFKKGMGVIVSRAGRRATYHAFMKYRLILFKEPKFIKEEWIGIELKPAGARVLGLPVTDNMWIGISTPENKDSLVGKVIIV